VRGSSAMSDAHVHSHPPLKHTHSLKGVLERATTIRRNFSSLTVINPRFLLSHHVNSGYGPHPTTKILPFPGRFVCNNNGDVSNRSRIYLACLLINKYLKYMFGNRRIMNADGSGVGVYAPGDFFARVPTAQYNSFHGTTDIQHTDLRMYNRDFG
jgi:hypothetical protein